MNHSTFRSGRLTILGVGLLLTSLSAGCGQAPPAAEPPPAPVEVVRAEKKTLDEWIAFPASTQAVPNHEARVTAAVEGRVLLIPPAGAGEWVKAGAVILRLDDRIAKQNLAKAGGLPKELEAQRKEGDNAVQVARANLRRLQKLRESTASSPTPLVSAPEVEKAQAALTSAEAQLEVIAAKQASSRADVEALKKQVELYTMRAPIAGWLGPIQVVPGQTVAVGTPIADIVELDEIDVVCFVPPSRLARLALGQPAVVTSADGAAEADRPEAAGPEAGGPKAARTEGQVVYVARKAQAETGAFEVRVRFPNKELKLPANAVVDILIRTTAPAERLVVPDTALLEDQSPPEVVVVTAFETQEKDKVGKVRVLQAVIGVRNHQRHLVEIVALRDPANKAPAPALGDCWFVVAGAHGLEDGDEVRVVEPEAAEK